MLLCTSIQHACYRIFELQGPLAALPVPYRTTEKQPTFFSLTVPYTGNYTLFFKNCLSSQCIASLLQTEVNDCSSGYSCELNFVSFLHEGQCV